MQNLQDLLLLCDRLSTKGVTPSVAMLRAKANNALTLPQAIKVIQRYNSGERAKTISTKRDSTAVKSSEKNNLTLEQRIVALEEQNKQLNDRLSAVEYSLNKLK